MNIHPLERVEETQTQPNIQNPPQQPQVQQKKRKRQKKQYEKVDPNKIIEKAKISRVHKLGFQDSEKQRFALIQAHPLKLCISGVKCQQLSTDQLKYFFSQILTTMAPQLSKGIKDVVFDDSLTFGVLELNNRRTKDYFRRNQDFTYNGMTLRIKKPKTFFEERWKQEKSKQQDQDHKIFMGGFPTYYQEHIVRQMCQTFGKLKYFNMVFQKGVSKGYCFFMYDDPSNAEIAIKTLNNLSVTDRRLRVQKASSRIKSDNHEINTRPSNYIIDQAGSFMLSYQNYSDPHVQLTIRIPSQSQIPSRVLQLLNMCYPQDLYDDNFYFELLMDVKHEASKYGNLQDVVIPRPHPQCGYAVPSIGKVFVKFTYILPARRARQAISGKVYNKRTCIASFYPEQRFDLRQYLIGY